MNKKQVLKRLNATLQQLLKLEPGQFYYSSYVASFNANNLCGTTCCVAGWYPQWFPKSGFQYNKYREQKLVHNKYSIEFALKTYHGIGLSFVRCLFYGESHGYYSARYGIYSDLTEVIDLWYKVIKAIENNDLDYKL